MTYKQLIVEVVKLLGEGSFNVEVEFWHHAKTSYSEVHESLKWQIWCVKRQKHFEGPTAEHALAALKECILLEEKIVPIAAGLDAVNA